MQDLRIKHVTFRENFQLLKVGNAEQVVDRQVRAADYGIEMDERGWIAYWPKDNPNRVHVLPPAMVQVIEYEPAPEQRKK